MKGLVKHRRRNVPCPASFIDLKLNVKLGLAFIWLAPNPTFLLHGVLRRHTMSASSYATESVVGKVSS